MTSNLSDYELKTACTHKLRQNEITRGLNSTLLAVTELEKLECFMSGLSIVHSLRGGGGGMK